MVLHYYGKLAANISNISSSPFFLSFSSRIPIIHILYALGFLFISSITFNISFIYIISLLLHTTFWNVILISSLSLNSFVHVIIIKEQKKISLKLWKMTWGWEGEASSDNLPVYLTRVEPSQVSLYFSHDYVEVVREKS